jgi:hypothetical protein
MKRLPDGFIIPAQPVLASKPPSGTDWVHEIKHDVAGTDVGNILTGPRAGQTYLVTGVPPTTGLISGGLRQEPHVADRDA